MQIFVIKKVNKRNKKQNVKNSCVKSTKKLCWKFWKYLALTESDNLTNHQKMFLNVTTNSSTRLELVARCDFKTYSREQLEGSANPTDHQKISFVLCWIPMFWARIQKFCISTKPKFNKWKSSLGAKSLGLRSFK